MTSPVLPAGFGGCADLAPDSQSQSNEDEHTPKNSSDPQGTSSSSSSNQRRLSNSSTCGVSPRVFGRSRRGCYTCRKRKVKCNEERPVCGHCRRLQLECRYTPLSENAFDASSLQPQRHRQNVALPRDDDGALPAGRPLSESQARGNLNVESRVANPSRAQSVGYDTATGPGYDSNLMENLVPNLSVDIAMTGQATHQRMSSPDTWELELMGEDSLWANVPILSNFISVQESPPYEHVSSYEASQPLMIPNASSNRQFASGIPANGAGGSVAQLEMHTSSEQNSFTPADEITLLRHFVDFAVPPILIGVEPRWNALRDALLRLSKYNLPLRNAICAFSALSLEEAGTRTSSARQSSTFYSSLAMNQLGKLLDEHTNGNTTPESQESILATIFFLSYVELIISNVPKSSVDLLDRAHSLLSIGTPSTSALHNQLQIWIKLLDAKAVSAGGKGIHLHTNPDTQDLDIVRESYDSTGNEQGDVLIPMLETEEIIFNSLNRQPYNFYVQVLNFSGRIARLDKWHRSRGSVQDELEVMLTADKVIRDLNALWTRRPAIIDLADQREQLRRYLTPSLATKVEHHLRTYTANYYACFTHLQRVAYAHLRAISQVKPAVAKIVKLSRMTVDEGHALPVSMLWPLMMAACEAEDEETQDWVIGRIEGMRGKVGNATKTAKLVREIIKRQKGGQRADARTVMHEVFGGVFAII